MRMRMRMKPKKIRMKDHRRMIRGQENRGLEIVWEYAAVCV